MPFIGYPPDQKSKAVHYTRRKKEIVTEENFRSVLTFGDVPADPFSSLQVLLDEVIGSLVPMSETESDSALKLGYESENRCSVPCLNSP